MESRKKALMKPIELADERRKTLLELYKRSKNETASAIYMLASEICELEKLIALLLMKR